VFFFLKASCAFLSSVPGAAGLYTYLMTNRPDLQLWHTVNLDEKYTIENRGEVTPFDRYLERCLWDVAREEAIA